MTKKHKEKSRTVRHLIQSAARGNINSSYQLYLNYSKGKNVEEKNDELAQEYFDEVEKALIEKRLTLASLHLSDFRRFQALDISFDDKVTVIIGDNGAGKTSITEAISKIFTWFNNNLEKTDVNGRPVVPADINVNSTGYAEVTAVFNFDKENSFETTIGRVTPGYIGSSPTEVASIKQVANMYKQAANNRTVAIPLFAFYSVERSNFNLTEVIPEKSVADTVSNRFSDLKTALEGNGKLEDFSKLYIELVNLAEGENTNEAKALKGQIWTLQSTIEDVYEGKTPPENDIFTAKLAQKKEELKKILSSKSSEKYQQHLDLVNYAIETLVPDVKNIEVDRSSGHPRLLVENFGNIINITQLSQGQKMLVALAGDLVRRLVKLNPDSVAPLHSHGIVLIDEIELHLHPKWQQTILTGLQATFPNLQFIVTTHSPQVLSTIDKKCIRILRFDNDGAAAIDTPKYQTKGVCSSDVLEQIMSTFSTPFVEEANWLTNYSAYIADNKWMTEEAQQLFEKIVSHFGSEHPEVVKVKGDIRVQELKLKAKRITGR